MIDAASQVLTIRGRSEPPEARNPDVAWGPRAVDGVWVPTRNGQRLQIGLPGPADDHAVTAVRPSLRLFPGVATDTDLIAQTTTTGIRLITVAHGPGAPAEFRFAVGLGEGLSLDATPSGGYDVVHDRYGATVGRFHAPWACDALYRPIPAAYDLDDSALVMTVGHREADALYPVIADPFYAR
ncbi:hypothetical protein NE236_37255 [Actinoallomurus purpureus]|uniref:hypothetical protein n=1 Tax=Actinoallomurus purpureus TaxID=478114 RepID=UPI002092C6C4|nr:hypothetical protein [Actinoallomurus purpureus]MCO6010620.1 hypothetical protein [Actinoallomurus purpureus]